MKLTTAYFDIGNADDLVVDGHPSHLKVTLYIGNRKTEKVRYPHEVFIGSFLPDEIPARTFVACREYLARVGLPTDDETVTQVQSLMLQIYRANKR